MTYADRLVQIADERAAKAIAEQPPTDANYAAVVVSVSADGLTAMVTQDGAQTPTPVKVMGHVHCRAGDRVGVGKWGEWYVCGVFGRVAGLAEAYVSQAGQVGSASTSWADLPGSPGGTFSKRWTASQVAVDVAVSGYSTLTGSVINVGITKDGGSTTDKVFDFQAAVNSGNSADLNRHSISGTGQFAWAAGTYTWRLRWMLAGGGQAFQTDADDWVSARLREVFV